jgi:hypothetical protein
VPGATPIPRGPTVLTLYTAADLLTGPGCPVCRYADEAADRYLAWFALEGHADTGTVTRLCASLGMCSRHTRGLMSQPGAGRRLTALYRYLTRAARGRLAGRAARPGGCPACEHDDGATGRALDTLLDGLADSRVRDRYRELGGLCIPHLRAASARGDHRILSCLAQTMTAAVSAGLASPGWLAGTDRDADTRAVLRDARPAALLPDSGACAACLAAGRAADARLARIADGGGSAGPLDARLLLCAGHLSDRIVLAGQPAVPSLLAWQAGSLAAALSERRPAPSRASWPRFRRRGADLGACPVCVDTAVAAERALDDLRRQLRAGRSVVRHPTPLCVRHLLSLKAADPWAGQVAATGAIDRADLLIAELDQAFNNATWTHRHQARGPEMTAWRRAAAFLDGDVFCGCPPRPHAGRADPDPRPRSG